MDFAEVIKRYSAPDVLAYLDPPYFPSTRCDPGQYQHEMTAEQHQELARLLNAFPGMAAVSGYRCPEYDAWYAGWERHDRDVACSMSHVGGTRDTKGQARPRRVESLWLNPAAVATRRERGDQLRLFV